MEAEQERLQGQMQDPAFYQRDKRDITEVKDRLDRLPKELEEAYGRWERLEAMS